MPPEGDHIPIVEGGNEVPLVLQDLTTQEKLFMVYPEP